MAVGKGKFLLYSKIDPPLTAGTYRFTAEQRLSTDDLDSDDLKVEKLETHVRVRSPLFVLPPDQVLSTYPPAGREGAFGSRLPQIVLKRRTLPWERNVDPVDLGQVDPDAELENAPWLALVVVAEGEAELTSNAPVAECVTPGVAIPGLADSQTGNSLHVRKSVVDRIFPTQEEVHLLAHAREVDITDTELMMGDDDGFLSVVISNRLPLPGRDEDGNDVPVKYLACLVNLCGQFHRLLPEAPEPPTVNVFTPFPLVQQLATDLTLASKDHLQMGTVSAALQDLSPKAVPGGTVISRHVVDPQGRAAFEAQSGWGVGERLRGASDVYVEMARDFNVRDVDVSGVLDVFDPTLRFPVLIHWSFTSVGDETFESLMKGLDSGLLGTRGAPDPSSPEDDPPPSSGRLPLEVVETGHVGLPHRLRRGDEVRSWYRGPLLPHPADEAADRLPLAHAADQIRVVVPDGREDVSLAAAFEVGRLLGLSRPSMVASLMRWRQRGFQRARLAGTVDSGFLGQLADIVGNIDQFIGGRLGAGLVQAMIASPEDVVGLPSMLVTPGRPLADGITANTVLATGLGLSEKVFDGDPLTVLKTLRTVDVRVPQHDLQANVGLIKQTLDPALDHRFSRASIQAIAPSLTDDVLRGGGVVGVPLDLGLAFGDIALDPAVLGGITLDASILAGPRRFEPQKGGDALDGLMEHQRRVRAEADDDEGEVP